MATQGKVMSYSGGEGTIFWPAEEILYNFQTADVDSGSPEVGDDCTFTPGNADGLPQATGVSV